MRIAHLHQPIGGFRASPLSSASPSPASASTSASTTSSATIPRRRPSLKSVSVCSLAPPKSTKAQCEFVVNAGLTFNLLVAARMMLCRRGLASFAGSLREAPVGWNYTAARVPTFDRAGVTHRGENRRLNVSLTAIAPRLNKSIYDLPLANRWYECYSDC